MGGDYGGGYGMSSMGGYGRGGVSVTLKIYIENSFLAVPLIYIISLRNPLFIMCADTFIFFLQLSFFVHQYGGGGYGGRGGVSVESAYTFLHSSAMFVN